MNALRSIAVVLAVLPGWLVIPETAQAQTSLTFNNQTGLFTLLWNTVDLVKSSFVFWHDNWQWSGVGVSGRPSGPGEYAIGGTSTGTGLTVAGRATRTAPNQLTWTMSLTRSEGRDSYKEWGGISFKLDFNPIAVGSFAPSPKLLPENAGWELQLEPDKPPLQVKFSPRPASVHFERDNPHEIRVYFNEAGRPFPSAPFTMTVTLPPGGIDRALA